MEREGRVIAEAMERMVEEKVRKMVKEKKEDDKKKDERLEEMEEKIKRLERKVDRLEQGGGKRKRTDSEESEEGEKKWWAGVGEGSENELRRKNVIIRVEKKKWEGKKSNWDKVKELLTEGLKVKVTKDVVVLGQRGAWLTILVKLADKEEKWRVLEAKRKAWNRVGVKIHEDKSVERRDRERIEREKREEGKRNVRMKVGRLEEEEISKEMEEAHGIRRKEGGEVQKMGQIRRSRSRTGRRKAEGRVAEETEKEEERRKGIWGRGG